MEFITQETIDPAPVLFLDVSTPDCGKPVMRECSDDGSRYFEHADPFFFQREHRQNRVCRECGSMLWAPVVPGRNIPWTKITDFGWICKEWASVYLILLCVKVAGPAVAFAVLVHQAGNHPVEQMELWPAGDRPSHKRVCGCDAKEHRRFQQHSAQGGKDAGNRPGEDCRRGTCAKIRVVKVLRSNPVSTHLGFVMSTCSPELTRCSTHGCAGL